MAIMEWSEALDIGVEPMDDQHQTLVDLTEFNTSFDDGGDLSTKFFHFLKQWLIAHIQVIDRKHAVWSCA